MSRRRVAAKREVIPDPRFGSVMLTKFMNMVMESGKKSVAEKIVYGALDVIEGKGHAEPLEVLTRALENVQPRVDVAFYGPYVKPHGTGIEDETLDWNPLR